MHLVNKTIHWERNTNLPRRDVFYSETQGEVEAVVPVERPRHDCPLLNTTKTTKIPDIQPKISRGFIVKDTQSLTVQ